MADRILETSTSTRSGRPYERFRKTLESNVTRVKSLTTLHLSFQLFAQTGHDEEAQGLDAS